MTGINVTNSNNENLNAYADGGIVKLYGSKTPEIVVLGDSHALMWARVLDEIARQLDKSISFYSADGTPTFFNIAPTRKIKASHFFSTEQRYVFDNARLHFLEIWKPGVVVIVKRWSALKDPAATTDLIEYIGSLGSKIILIEQPPELFFGHKNAPQYFSYLDLKPANRLKQYTRATDNPKYQNGINMINYLTTRYDHCSSVAISDLFLSDDKVWVIDSYDVLYIDDDHLSYAGTLKAKQRIAAAIQAQI
jgi:hypothetical protein